MNAREVTEDEIDRQVDSHVGALRRAAYLLGPIAASALIWFGFYLFAEDERYAWDMLTAAGASLFGLGTTVVFGKAVLAEHLLLTTWDLAFVVMYVNAVSGWWYAYNLDLGQRLPGIGPYLARARANAVATLRARPWIRRFSTIGVGFFVLTPLPGSGALGGCIMGRIIGISKFASFMAVSCAGVIVCYAYASAASRLEPLILHAPVWIKVVVGLLSLVLIYFMIKLLFRLMGMGPGPQVGKGNPAGTGRQVDAAGT